MTRKMLTLLAVPSNTVDVADTLAQVEVSLFTSVDSFDLQERCVGSLLPLRPVEL